jgi:hypothetical protein
MSFNGHLFFFFIIFLEDAQTGLVCKYNIAADIGTPYRELWI